jgi:hypothetical protein
MEDFENQLSGFGYVDNSIVYPKPPKINHPVRYNCSNGSMTITTFLITYPNKKSYLHLEFLDGGNVKKLAEKILFEEKTRVIEVGYEVSYTKQPSEFSLEERNKIFTHFMKQTKSHLRCGLLDQKPNSGDILAALPYGPKINLGFTETGLDIGKRQRALVAQRFGFGKLYDDNFQYARYDENLILRPI